MLSVRHALRSQPFRGGEERVGGVNHYELVETTVGMAATGWNGVGITALRLPGSTGRETGRAIERRLPGAVRGQPPAAVAAILDAVSRNFAGTPAHFRRVPVHPAAQTPFFPRVYDRLRERVWGETPPHGPT